MKRFIVFTLFLLFLLLLARVLDGEALQRRFSHQDTPAADTIE